jgi:hypothetical protein
MGPKTRAWLFLGTFIQALFTMAAAIATWASGEPSISTSRGDIVWSNARSYAALGFVAASLGLQGIMGKRVNTQFATTGQCSPRRARVGAADQPSRLQSCSQACGVS